MKVPVSWLREYVSVELSPKELGHRLTMAGVEVGGITTIGDVWDRIYVGQVSKIEDHPNADRLALATVDIDGELHTVVCGAPNIAVGQKVPFAKEGAQLFDPKTGTLSVLKKANIRGIVSAGMVCSELELGLGDRHEGIVVLPDDTPLGIPLSDCMGDAILDVEVTPNRPDCLSLLGVAWETAALTGETVVMPKRDYSETATAIAKQVAIKVEDSELAPRYMASLVLDVMVGPSPQWMQDRLVKAGLRPINNVVDITNYVMLEFGQPLHAFDYHKLAGQKLIVRQARPGELLTTLDGQKRKLDPPMLVIADAKGPVALAGVMGGIGSEVTDKTVAVLLESANFNAGNNRRTAATLKLRTDASTRFEKGLNPALAEHGLRRATHLISRLAGGRVAAGMMDIGSGHHGADPVCLPEGRLSRILGVSFPQHQVESVLTSLGFQCSYGPQPSVSGAVPKRRRQTVREGDLDNTLWAIPPFWRSDITISEDLVEEVARIVGYDSIPPVMPGSRISGVQSQPVLKLRETVKDILVSCGLQETISYSLVSKTLIDKASLDPGAPEPLRLVNPLSAEQEYLRTSLRGSVLIALAANERQVLGGLRLFESGRVYLPADSGLPHEKEMVVGMVAGSRNESSWRADTGAMNFFDVKGVLEALLGQLGCRGEFRGTENPFLRPGCSATVGINGKVIGLVGEIHPKVLGDFGVTTPTVAFFELDLDSLQASNSGILPRYRPISRFPGAVRDMALVVKQSVPAEDIASLIESSPLVSRVILFDVYTGEGVPADKRSLAFRIVFQSGQGTLTSRDVNQAENKILKILEKETGAVLRV